jgi:hypothetical protein
LNLYFLLGTAVGDLGLSLTGLRIGPRDPATHAPKVGVRNEIVKPEHSLASLQPRILKVLLLFIINLFSIISQSIKYLKLLQNLNFIMKIIDRNKIK